MPESNERAITGVKWGSVIDTICKFMGEHEEDIRSMAKFGRYKTERKRRTERREMLALDKKVEGEEHIEIHGRL